MSVFIVSDYDHIIGVYSSLELAEEARRRIPDFTFNPERYEIDQLPADQFTQTVVGQGI